MKLTRFQVNRRELLGSAIALAAPIGLHGGQEKEGEARKEYRLRNASIDVSLVTRQGRITSRRLTNNLANEVVDLPVTDFAFEFDGGRVTDSSAFRASVWQKSAESLQLLYSGKTDAVADLQVRVEYSLLPAKRYLRKQLSIRHTGKG